MLADITKEELKETIALFNEESGYDFSDYALTSLKRRFLRFIQQHKIDSIAELTSRLREEKPFFHSMLESITVNVTEMFRDPLFYYELRKHVVKTLATYPNIKIWHAGCATGEEVYSMAILLHEEGLLEKTRLYATDLNRANLEKARQGILPLSAMKDYTSNYIQSGGKGQFSDYYTARYENVIIDKEIRKNIIFSQHNLVTDRVFNEFHLVCCRNVLIYFNRHLQNRVINLFYDSLAPLGYLALGSKESLLFTDVKNKFETISQTNKIFRRKA